MHTNLVSFKKTSMKYLDISLNLEINQNDFILFVGKNGCGKSTFIKLILGFMKPDEGTVTTSVDSISYLPEVVHLPETIKVAEYIELIEKIKKVSTNEKWLFKLGLPLFKKIQHLSKGNRQKLGVYSSLIGNERLVVLDEPLSGLDKATKKVVSEMIKEKSITSCVIVSTHEKKLFDKFKTKEVALSD